MTASNRYYASCPKGIEDLLLSELQALQIPKPELAHSGVHFEGGLEAAYRVCLWSRLASRVFQPLKNFEVLSEDGLYQQVQMINWSEHLSVEGTLAVNCNLSDSALTNSHYASLRVKDAIVDQFNERYDKRPSVDREKPDVRINLHIHRNQATLSLDLAGDPLHKRGYRMSNVAAPLKENLASAILMRSGWPNASLTLVDLMCGSGTFLTEAALMALNIAPGLRRDYYGFMGWKGHDDGLWRNLLNQAKTSQQDKSHFNLQIRGYDASIASVKAAKQNVHAAGLQQYIQIEQRDLEHCQAPDEMAPGLVIVNPPYGERLGDVRELAYLYSDIGECWRKHFAGWTTALFTGNLDLAKNIGLRSHKSNTFFNGAIKCKLFQYSIRQAPSDEVKAKIEQRDAESMAMIANRLKKNFKHISRWARRNNIECYRVYDADLPEYAAAIDIYADWVQVQEYQAPSTIDIRKARLRLDHLISVVPEVLGVDRNKLVVKTRRQQKGLAQYEKQASAGSEFQVHEAGLSFVVNLQDYLDTGLFLDHRDTRAMIRDMCKDKHFLNLFAYTGSVSVYAAAGGAASTTTIDMSNTYLNWAKQNFKINNFIHNHHNFIKADCVNWLQKQAQHPDEYFDVIFLDPPTFSNSKTMQGVFDIQKDHVMLIESAMKLLAPNGILVFSNNFRKFRLEPTLSERFHIEDIRKQTIPEDFKRNPKIHGCWLIRQQ